jgi:hypothetical protein
VVKNGRVPALIAPPSPAAGRIAVIALTFALLVASTTLAACGTGRPPQLDGGSVPSSVPTAPTDPAGQLAGLAAAAQDRHYVAGYTFKSSGHADRTVVVSVAADRTWTVNIPGGALSGGADVSIVGTKTGTYQCVLGGAATSLATANQPTAPPSTPASGSPSTSATTPTTPTRYAAPACVKLAAAGKAIASRYDPVIEHVFADWLSVLSDREAPISVFHASALAGSTGACYSVEPSAVSLAPVVDAGIFCFLPDGTLTAATLAVGSLTLTGALAAGPPSDALPAPIVAGPAAPIKAAAS